MEKISLLGDVTPNAMIEAKYDRAKLICSNIWDKPDKCSFEDIFHDTIYNCLIHLENKKFDQDYLKAYFFKAFRINMVRYYGYSYNKLTSGKEVETVLIPVENKFEDHFDGFQMLNYVKQHHGEEIHNMLWDNLNGMTYSDLKDKYHINAFYYLSKLKDEIKHYYFKDLYYKGNLILH